MLLAVVFVQLAENLAQWGEAAGFVQFAFNDLTTMDDDAGQV